MGVRPGIEEFARLAGVRPRPGEALPWQRAMSEVGLRLPPDYRAFLDAFGSGELYERLGLTTPWPLRDPSAGSAPLRAFLADALDTCEGLRQLRTDHPGAVPFPLLPEPGGLLPWAWGIGGELCAWLTPPDAEPEGWPVAVWDKAEWRTYGLGMVGLLLRVVSGGDAFLGVFRDPSAPLWTPRA